MKRVALLFNTDRLGGAERSMALQFREILKTREFLCHCFIPQIRNERKFFDLQNYLSNFHLPTFIFFYPKFIAQISRKWLRLTNLWDFLFLPYDFVKMSSTVKIIFDYDLIYFNGNKVAYLFIPFLSLFRFKGKVIWHWRDYPVNGGGFKFLLKIFSKLDIQMTFISNSHSVRDALIKAGISQSVSTVYNPIGDLKFLNHTQISKIGLVSMIAPWKGIHQIILWWGIYKESLKNIGIDELIVFGDQIYKTKGDHSNYLEQLKLLVNKLNISGITFQGNKKPENIFKEIDILIHPTIEKEPFGRVLVEAMSSGVLAISTAMGGASELCLHEKTALRFRSYEYSELFNMIVGISQNMEKREMIIAKAFDFSRGIDLKAKQIFEEKIKNELNINITKKDETLAA